MIDPSVVWVRTKTMDGDDAETRLSVRQSAQDSGVKPLTQRQGCQMHPGSCHPEEDVSAMAVTVVSLFTYCITEALDPPFELCYIRVTTSMSTSALGLPFRLHFSHCGAACWSLIIYWISGLCDGSLTALLVKFRD